VKQNGEFYSTVWNCKTDNNQSIGSGTYIIRITAGEYTGLKKIVIVK